MPGGPSATLYSIAPELLAQSNWSRHEFKAELRGSYIGYNPDQTPTLGRSNLNGKVDGRIDVTHETRVDLGGRLLVSTDNPGSPNLQAGLAKLPMFVTVGGSASLGHTFNRVDVSLKGDVERIIYQDSTLTDGSVVSNIDRQYTQYDVKLRGSYELSPAMKPFVEVGADNRVHDVDIDFAGYRRDSKGVTGLMGATFNEHGIVTGEIGVGYTQRTSDDPRLDTLSALIGQASLIWKPDALNTVKLTGNSGIGESTIPGVAGRDLARRRTAGRPFVPPLADRHAETGFRYRQLYGRFG